MTYLADCAEISLIAFSTQTSEGDVGRIGGRADTRLIQRTLKHYISGGIGSPVARIRSYGEVAVAGDMTGTGVARLLGV
jgi:hypothetical protein